VSAPEPTLSQVRELLAEACAELEACEPFELEPAAQEAEDEARAEFFRRQALGLSYIRGDEEGWY
jgi:hypothetical protein